MELNEQVMDARERIGFQLRSLYHAHGYHRYRMSKFEEYDLYSRNKDFLFSESVITFTDTNGRLMALKPDVTLSIVKNVRDCGELQRLYYHENVYRVSSAADGFREQTQVGVECMGPVDSACLGSVLKLAAESLAMISPRYILEISHLDLLTAFVDAIAPDDETRRKILVCAGEKNPHGIRQLCREAGVSDGAEQPLLDLLNLYGEPKKVLPRIRTLAEEYGCGDEARQLSRLAAMFAGTEAETRLWIDFSATGDTKYYNGIALKGFIDGVPDCVLSGGQYDALMRRMGRKDRAVGFAVFLDRLDRLTEGGGEDA